MRSHAGFSILAGIVWAALAPVAGAQTTGESSTVPLAQIAPADQTNTQDASNIDAIPPDTSPATAASRESQSVEPSGDRGFRSYATRIIRRVGVHANLSVRNPADTDVTKGTTIGPSIGLSPGRTSGWKTPVSLTMFSEDLHGPNGVQFGMVHTKAILVGFGYGWHVGRLSAGPDVEAGYAFNSGELNGDVDGAFGAAIGSVSMHIGNSMLLRPRVKAEYFLTEKLTLRASADYVLMRPDITVETTEGTVSNWDPSHVHFNVGVGYYPFRR
jgi:hypothetical protein